MAVQNKKKDDTIFPFDDINARTPQRLVLPPIESYWNSRVLHSQPSLDLEGGALSPLGSPKKDTPPATNRQRHDKYGPVIQNDPAAATVDDLLKLQADLKDISSSK